MITLSPEIANNNALAEAFNAIGPDKPNVLANKPGRLVLWPGTTKRCEARNNAGLTSEGNSASLVGWARRGASPSELNRLALEGVS